MAGIAAQRTTVTSIIKAPVLLTRIVYRFLPGNDYEVRRNEVQ
jgi:hypothetical protein